MESYHLLLNYLGTISGQNEGMYRIQLCTHWRVHQNFMDSAKPMITEKALVNTVEHKAKQKVMNMGKRFVEKRWDCQEKKREASRIERE